MLCDGKCKTKNKRCGLLQEMAHYTPNGGKIAGSEYDRCMFGAILDKLCDLGKDNIRVQAAIESSRNQKNKDDLESVKTLSQGFLGIIHTLQQGSESQNKLRKMLKGLLDTVQEVENEQKKIEQAEVEQRNVSLIN